MNKSPLISVIIPVYKVEEYLDACVRSVVNQTYKNLEIVLVDDGSPDRCPEICDEWAGKDARIRVIHKENGGLSDARNAGIKASSGRYLAFVDSDDLIEKTTIESLFKACEETGAGISECNYIAFEKDEDAFPIIEPAAPEVVEYNSLGDSKRNSTQDSIKDSPEVIVKGPQEALNDLLDENTFKVVVWNKLYRREIFEDLKFEVGRIHEDVFFTYQAFGSARLAAKMEKPLYAYRRRKDSIMGNGFSLKNLDAAEACRRRYYYIRENYPKLAAKAQAKALGLSIYLGQKAMREAESKTAQTSLHELKILYDELYSAQEIRDTAKQKFWYRCAKRNFSVCCRMRNQLKIGI